MSKSPELPLYKFVVTTLVLDKPVKSVVEAAYYQEAGRFTQLKDASHVVVDAFLTDTVLRVSRTGDPVYDLG
jgi:predicted ATPase